MRLAQVLYSRGFGSRRHCAGLVAAGLVRLSGRVVDAAKGNARIELGEGLIAACALPKEQRTKDQPETAGGRADVSALSAMPAARWKQGAAVSSSSMGEPVRTGQIRTFRIKVLDPGSKRIEVELAG